MPHSTRTGMYYARAAQLRVPVLYRKCLRFTSKVQYGCVKQTNSESNEKIYSRHFMKKWRTLLMVNFDVPQITKVQARCLPERTQ